MPKPTSRERIRELHNKHRMEENFDPHERQEKERKRIVAIRKRQKLQREQNDKLKENFTLKEKKQRINRSKKTNRGCACNIKQRNKTTGEKGQLLYCSEPC